MGKALTGRAGLSVKYKTSQIEFGSVVAIGRGTGRTGRARGDEEGGEGVDLVKSERSVEREGERVLGLSSSKDPCTVASLDGQDLSGGGEVGGVGDEGGSSGVLWSVIALARSSREVKGRYKVGLTADTPTPSRIWATAMKEAGESSGKAYSQGLVGVTPAAVRAPSRKETWVASCEPISERR